jgi:hypothetical protein
MKVVDWIKARVAEKSSWNGILIGAAALFVLIGGFSLVKTAVYVAIIWAIYNIVWKED